jgi:hypothetical protein
VKRTAARSSHELAEEVARGVLAAGGGALKAALSGYFAAAGTAPGVLLAPLTLLVGGTGEAARAFDGRVRQPGLDGRRPRGFLPGEPVPVAARAAVPQGIAALAVAAGYHPGVSLAACVRPGVQAAKQAGAARRAEMLEFVGGHGAGALAAPLLARDWLAELGPVSGGACTQADLAPRGDLDAPCFEQPLGFASPFETAGAPPLPGREHALVAVDVAGLFVALAFAELDEGAPLLGGELLAPLLGEPVRRGVPRLRPGAPLGFDVELALERDQEARIVRAVGRARAAGSSPRSLAVSRDPVTKLAS